MVKRHVDGAVVAACAASCLDVQPSQVHRAADQPVLGSIENLPAARLDSLRFISNKKQCRLGVDQSIKPVCSSSLFAQARAVLRHPSSNDSQAPVGREQEFAALKECFEEFSSSGCGSSVYVSGLPGTGKSHTVRQTLSHLLSCSTQPRGCLVTWVNCMSVSSPGEVFAHIAATARSGTSNSDWQQQQQQHPHSQEEEQLPLYEDQPHREQQQQSMSFEALLDCLQQQHMHAALPNSSSKAGKGAKRYRAARTTPRSSTPASENATNTNNNNSSSSSSLQQPPHIVVLDEIDNIAKQSLPGLVQLFKLPHTPGVSLMVVGIANSIDLTERTLPELRLQLVTPRLITFSAYTAAQLAAILEKVLDQLPSRLFAPVAVQLCCRSVGASNGDLRSALKACRAALDDLEQQQQQEASGSLDDTSLPAQGTTHSSAGVIAPAAAAPMVGVKQMSQALARLAGVRSSQFGGQASSIIRALPNQQQMLLYALVVFCQQPEESAEGGAPGAPAACGAAKCDPVTPSHKASASSLWKGAGSAALLSSSGNHSPSVSGGSWLGLKKGKKRAAAVSGSGQAGPQASSVFVLAVSAEAAFTQYVKVCKLLKLPCCSKAELLHMADLLAQMALLDVITTPAAAGAGVGVKGSSGSTAGSKGPLKGFKGGSKGSFGGLGGRGLLGGSSRGGLGLGRSNSGSPMSAAAAGGAGGQGDVKLCLRASSSEVFAALKHNPALRCLVDA